MFWFNKNHPETIYMDNRELEDVLCDGRKLEVKPDIVADFRKMPFADNTFNLVIFDPPHLISAGQESWLCKKYGKLGKDWQKDIRQGFDECMRVLRPHGTLVFKWSEIQITMKEILSAVEVQPLIFHKNNRTYFLVFMKEREVLI